MLPQGQLNRQLFEAVVRSAPSIRYIDLHGEGEPTLHPEFAMMMRELRALGIDVGFITNGLLVTQDMASVIVDLGVRSVGISLDTLDPHVAAELRGTGPQVPLTAAKALLSRRYNGCRPDVYFCAVLLRRTFLKFDDLIALSKDLGMSPPSAQPLQRKQDYVAHYPPELNGEQLSMEQTEWLQWYLKRRSEQRRMSGLRTYYEDLFVGREHEPCPFAQHSLYVRANGGVFPCCFCQTDLLRFGKATVDAGVEEVTCSPTRMALIAAFEDGETPDACKGCWVPCRSNQKWEESDTNVR